MLNKMIKFKLPTSEVTDMVIEKLDGIEVCYTVFGDTLAISCSMTQAPAISRVVVSRGAVPMAPSPEEAFDDLIKMLDDNSGVFKRLGVR